MLTKFWKRDRLKVEVSSLDDRVQVSVDQKADVPLTREEAHEALLETQAITHEFLAAVEADLDATASPGR